MGAQKASGGFAANQLRNFIERVERLEEEKAALVSDIREVYAEAKGQGFDTKIMRMVVRLRKLDAAVREEQLALLDLYLRALESGCDVAPEIEVRASRLIAGSRTDASEVAEADA